MSVDDIDYTMPKEPFFKKVAEILKTDQNLIYEVDNRPFTEILDNVYDHGRITGNVFGKVRKAYEDHLEYIINDNFPFDVFESQADTIEYDDVEVVWMIRFDYVNYFYNIMSGMVDSKYMVKEYETGDSLLISNIMKRIISDSVYSSFPSTGITKVGRYLGPTTHVDFDGNDVIIQHTPEEFFFDNKYFIGASEDSDISGVYGIIKDKITGEITPVDEYWWGFVWYWGDVDDSDLWNLIKSTEANHLFDWDYYYYADKDGRKQFVRDIINYMKEDAETVYMSTIHEAINNQGHGYEVERIYENIKNRKKLGLEIRDFEKKFLNKVDQAKEQIIQTAAGSKPAKQGQSSQWYRPLTIIAKNLPPEELCQLYGAVIDLCKSEPNKVDRLNRGIPRTPCTNILELFEQKCRIVLDKAGKKEPLLL